jgi:hypothetical protein
MYPWVTMKVGAFFFIPGRDRNTMASLAYSTGKKLDRKFATRLCYMAEGRRGWEWCDEDEPGATLGIGVWRVA